ncbi:MAG: hypothetical protein ACFB3T_12060 [Geminicoccaceae bacterium]
MKKQMLGEHAMNKVALFAAVIAFLAMPGLAMQQATAKTYERHNCSCLPDGEEVTDNC